MILFLVGSSESRREITINIERLWKLEHRATNWMRPVLRDSHCEQAHCENRRTFASLPAAYQYLYLDDVTISWVVLCGTKKKSYLENAYHLCNRLCYYSRWLVGGYTFRAVWYRRRQLCRAADSHCRTAQLRAHFYRDFCDYRMNSRTAKTLLGHDLWENVMVTA